MPETNSRNAGEIMSLDRQVHRKQLPLLCQAPFGRLMHGAEWKPWPNLCRSWNRKPMKTVMTCKGPRILNLVYLSPKTCNKKSWEMRFARLVITWGYHVAIMKSHGPHQPPNIFSQIWCQEIFFASNWITWQQTRCRWVSIVQSCIPFGEEARLVEPINSINLSCVTSSLMLLK